MAFMNSLGRCSCHATAVSLLFCFEYKYKDLKNMTTFFSIIYSHALYHILQYFVLLCFFCQYKFTFFSVVSQINDYRPRIMTSKVS